MAHRNMFSVSLLLIGILLASSPTAQDDDQQQTQGITDRQLQQTQGITDRQLQMLSEGVSVQQFESESIGFLSKMLLLLRHAFLQRPNVAPLHAYDPNIICRNESSDLLPLATHDGSAAILVTTDEGDALAIYRPTALDVATEARRDWCDAGNPVGWQFATTYPLDDLDEKGHYVTWEADLVDERLRAFHDRRRFDAAYTEWGNALNRLSSTVGASDKIPANREVESGSR